MNNKSVKQKMEATFFLSNYVEDCNRHSHLKQKNRSCLLLLRLYLVD